MATLTDTTRKREAGETARRSVRAPVRRPLTSARSDVVAVNGHDVRDAGQFNLARPSYRYRWHDLDFRSFRHLGVIARRAPDGAPRFNFPQTVWFQPDIAMDWAPTLTPTVVTLAVNVINPHFASGTVSAYFGTTSEGALKRARQFARFFLCTMPVAGGCVPRGVIEEWMRDEL